MKLSLGTNGNVGFEATPKPSQPKPELGNLRSGISQQGMKPLPPQEPPQLRPIPSIPQHGFVPQKQQNASQGQNMGQGLNRGYTPQIPGRFQKAPQQQSSQYQQEQSFPQEMLDNLPSYPPRPQAQVLQQQNVGQGSRMEGQGYEQQPKNPSDVLVNIRLDLINGMSVYIPVNESELESVLAMIDNSRQKCLPIMLSPIRRLYSEFIVFIDVENIEQSK